MGFTEKQLGQARPSDTSNATAYTVPGSTTANVSNIIIANTSGSAATARVFADKDGTTHDQSTAIVWDKNIPADDFVVIPGPIVLEAGGSIGVRSSVADALTFTANGAEIT